MYVYIHVFVVENSEQIRKALAQTELAGWHFWQRDTKLYVSTYFKIVLA